MNFPDSHAALDAAGFRLIADGGGNAPFLAGHHRLALELGIDRLLARRKKGIGIDVHDSTGKGPKRQRLHTGGLQCLRAYLRTTAVTTATTFSSSFGTIGL